MIMKFCIQYGSGTAKLCAKFQKGQVTDMDVMHKQVSMRF